jgi:hypothetical protein
MIIETKFSIGDVIYFMYGNKLHADRIGSIKTELYKDGSGGISYTLENYYLGKDLTFREKENIIFRNRSELWSHLEKNIVDNSEGINIKSAKHA